MKDKEQKPKILFLENVKNLISHDQGNTFRVIKETIEELGYVFNFSGFFYFPILRKAKKATT